MEKIMSSWIDVKQQLPETDGRYFALCDGDVFIAQYTKSNNNWRRDQSVSGLDQWVTHWMNIPPLK
jgi:hypothetical protein